MQQLMRHRADVWRLATVQHTAQEFDDAALVYRAVPCFVQPYDIPEAFFDAQRGQEGMGVIYTTDVTSEFKRNDIFVSNGQQFHVLGIKENLFFGLYRELSVVWYPEEAKKRLNYEAYE